MYDNDGEKLNRLIIAVSNGYADCLDGIYEMAGGKMLAVAAGIVGRSSAEDVLQESFIKIARFAYRYKKDNPYGWLMKIVRNTALDYIRRNKLRPEVSTEELYNLTSLDYSPDRREIAIALEQAISKLDGDEKKAIYYKYYIDMTVREIAAELNMSKSAVQRTIERAENKLKNFLDSGTKD